MISSVNNRGKCHWMIINDAFNADLKHAITTSVPKRTRQGLLKKTQEHMAMMKSTPERVKSYFKDKHVTYATEKSM